MTQFGPMDVSISDTGDFIEVTSVKMKPLVLSFALYFLLASRRNSFKHTDEANTPGERRIRQEEPRVMDDLWFVCPGPHTVLWAVT